MSNPYLPWNQPSGDPPKPWGQPAQQWGQPQPPFTPASGQPQGTPGQQWGHPGAHPAQWGQQTPVQQFPGAPQWSPQPPRKSRVGLWAGIIGGSLALGAAAIVAVVVLMRPSVHAGSSAPPLPEKVGSWQARLEEHKDGTHFKEYEKGGKVINAFSNKPRGIRPDPSKDREILLSDLEKLNLKPVQKGDGLYCADYRDFSQGGVGLDLDILSYGCTLLYRDNSMVTVMGSNEEDVLSFVKEFS